MKPVRCWVLVADAGRARVLEMKGNRLDTLAPVGGLEFEAELPPSREIGSDRPGRGFESVGHTRHAKESPSDPHRELKRRFAERLARMLHEQHTAKRFDRLVIVAPPATLGDLRAGLSDPLKSVVTNELAADLTKVPIEELPSHLQDIIGG